MARETVERKMRCNGRSGADSIVIVVSASHRAAPNGRRT
jgi:hypothetical protein